MTVVALAVSDEKYFQQVETSQSKEILATIKSYCRKYNDCFTPKEKSFICEFDIKEANSYGLVKIHKSKEVQQDTCSFNVTNTTWRHSGAEMVTLSPITF